MEYNSRAPFEMPSTSCEEEETITEKKKEKRSWGLCARDDARSTSRTAVGCKRFIRRASNSGNIIEDKKRGIYASLLSFSFFFEGVGVGETSGSSNQFPPPFFFFSFFLVTG